MNKEVWFYEDFVQAYVKYQELNDADRFKEEIKELNELIFQDEMFKVAKNEKQFNDNTLDLPNKINQEFMLKES